MQEAKTMSRKDALKNLEKGILTTAMLEPLGIGMESFLKFSQLDSKKQEVLLKKLAKGYRKYEDPSFLKKSSKERIEWWEKLRDK